MGNHIAHAAARDLLHRMKDAIERGFEVDEAAKGLAVHDTSFER
jgi:hypothetical protein